MLDNELSADSGASTTETNTETTNERSTAPANPSGGGTDSTSETATTSDPGSRSSGPPSAGRTTDDGAFRPVQPPRVLFKAPDLPSEPDPDPAEETGSGRRRRRRSEPVDAPADREDRGGESGAGDESADDTRSGAPNSEAQGDSDGGGDEGTRRRRRRRGGRRRRKGGDDSIDAADATDASEAAEASEDDDFKRGDGTTDAAQSDQADESADTGVDSSDEARDTDSDRADDDGSGEGTSGTRRRRRRRRRRGEPVEPAPDDPEVTVVKVREPRTDRDAVTAVEGSTRVEAKKQRRREGRDAGRRRAPVLTESEFLARRESVERSMIIRQHHDRTQIAVLEDGILVEHYVADQKQTSLIGNVYLGRVQNVLPSMEAAFVDIGRGRNAVLYAGEVNWEGVGLEGQPKRIESALKSGQTVLVQVTKDPVGHKGARLTSQISLPGRYLVYIPSGGMNGISRKLPDTERTRLKQLLKDIVPDEAGVVVRTAAEGASEEELARDVARLKAQWEAIEKAAGEGKAPSLLYAEPDLLVKVVRDLFTEDFTRLVVSGDEAWDMVEGYVNHVAPHLADRLERWTKTDDLFSAYRIDEQIMKALDRKVWLPSGGSLVIDRTEAMTVIDVNTGKFTGSGGNLEETVTKNNLEAAEEIVRQLRLRDIGGIIVVDFIDMVLESNRDLVLRRLVECLARDRTRHQVAEVTSLGLVQMTRKKIGTGLLEAFSETCEACKGRGFHIRLDPLGPTGAPGGPADGERRSRRRRRGGSGNGGTANGGSGDGEAASPDEANNGDAVAAADTSREANTSDTNTSDTNTSDTDTNTADVNTADVNTADVNTADTNTAGADRTSTRSSESASGGPWATESTATESTATESTAGGSTAGGSTADDGKAGERSRTRRGRTRRSKAGGDHQPAPQSESAAATSPPADAPTADGTAPAAAAATSTTAESTAVDSAEPHPSGFATPQPEANGAVGRGPDPEANGPRRLAETSAPEPGSGR